MSPCAGFQNRLVACLLPELNAKTANKEGLVRRFGIGSWKQCCKEFRRHQGQNETRDANSLKLQKSELLLFNMTVSRSVPREVKAFVLEGYSIHTYACICLYMYVYPPLGTVVAPSLYWQYIRSAVSVTGQGVLLGGAAGWPAAVAPSSTHKQLGGTWKFAAFNAM